mgnify:CR=1 FL=1
MPPPRPPPGPRGARGATGARGAAPPGLARGATKARGARGPPPGLAKPTAPSLPARGARPARAKPARGGARGGAARGGPKKTPPAATQTPPQPPPGVKKPVVAVKKAVIKKVVKKSAPSLKHAESAPVLKKTSVKRPLVRKEPEESELQIKNKSRQIREEIDDVKDLVRKQKKDSENESKVEAMQTKIQETEAKIRALEGIASPDYKERLAIVIKYAKGGAELKSLETDMKAADASMEKMIKQQTTANALVKNANAKVAAHRQASTHIPDAHNLNKLRNVLDAYQTEKQNFVRASEAGEMSSKVTVSMQRLIRKCDQLNAKEDQLSAELVGLEQDFSKVMGEAWQQTALHKFKIEVGVVKDLGSGKDGNLLDMEEEHGKILLEQRSNIKKQILQRLNSETEVFATLATGHNARTVYLSNSTEAEYAEVAKTNRKRLGVVTRKYRAGKQCEKQVLHEFEKLKVGYMAGRHLDLTKEQKLQRRVDRRRKLLDDHLDNIKATQDRIVASVEADWAPLVEREEKRGSSVVNAANSIRVNRDAKIRIEVTNSIEANYKPTLVELMTNIETLSVQGDRFGEEADAVEANLRAVMKEQQQVDIELLELKIMMQLDADKKVPKIIQKYQRQLRRLWKAGAVPMSQVEMFLEKLVDHADPTEVLMGLYESHIREAMLDVVPEQRDSMVPEQRDSMIPEQRDSMVPQEKEEVKISYMASEDVNRNLPSSTSLVLASPAKDDDSTISDYGGRSTDYSRPWAQSSKTDPGATTKERIVQKYEDELNAEFNNQQKSNELIKFIE